MKVIKIIGKLDVVSDPGDIAKEITNFICARHQVYKVLKSK